MTDRLSNWYIATQPGRAHLYEVALVLAVSWSDRPVDFAAHPRLLLIREWLVKLALNISS